jgi:nicotinamide-nucleotide amidase
MKAEIIASGTELLLGELTDANTPFIASQLAELGIDLYYASIVGDNYERFLGVLKQALQRSDITVITGGLGPTKGDITREVIAGLMGEKMEVEPSLKQHITAYFGRLGIEMPENNLKQATLIPSATVIPNPLGTAPGWWVEKGGKTIISLPGPPGEMQPMWQTEVVPRLETLGGAVILSRTLKTWGLSEAKIDELVGPFMSRPNPTLALYAKPDGIQLRITAKAADKESAAQLTRGRETELRGILGNSIWGADKETLEGAISRLMLDRGLTLAVAESFTGGLLACSLANAPESEKYLKGGVIAIDDKTKAALEISAGPGGKIDIQTAARMAEYARKQFNADIGIGIDGYYESDSQIPAGKAYIAINQKQVDHNFAQTYPWRSNLLVRRSVMQALFSLRKVLLEIPA